MNPLIHILNLGSLNLRVRVLSSRPIPFVSLYTSNLPEIKKLQEFEGVSNLPRKMDIFFEIEIFVSIVVFGTVPYFLFVYVLVPGYGHKPTQQTASKNMFMLKMLTILP